MRINPWKKIAVATAVVAASIGTGAAWAQQNQDPAGQEGAAAPAQSNDTRFIGTGTNDVKFVPVTPCRLADTRVHDQRFTPNTTQVFDVRGGGSTFAAQGGKPGGCGIPPAVTAVEVTVSAASADGNGFLRVYPGAVPAASFLSFNGTSASSNTGTVSICGHDGGMCLLNNDLKVRAYGAGTDVVIDINGYYARPMAGRIKANGSFNNNRISRITSVTVGADGVGTYYVTFDRKVNNCVPMVSPAPNPTYTVSATNHSSDNNSIYVKTVNINGSAQYNDFNIEVIC